MKIKEICASVWYVGVNDRRTALFEGLWPIPGGVSYNSYIVEGSESTALIDSVHVAEGPELLNNISSVLCHGKVNWLVVNHMEPDHSGSIATLLAAFPDLKIVCNRQAAGMIGGFYKITDPERFHIVGDGDTLSLGDKTLKFAMTPMVHWPETMMTYLVEDKVLFSGDAFGTFGALNGAVIDEEMTIEPYFEEMYRYYSNIVGKYGSAVQKALGKLKSVEISTICPTHGPVWRRDLKRAVDLTDRLSRYESEPGVTIVYGSMYGNTARVAEMVAEGLAEGGVKTIKMHDASVSAMSYMISDAFRYEGLVVGSPTYSMTVFPPVMQFLEALKTREVRGKVLGAIGNHTWAPSPLPTQIKAWAEEMKLPLQGFVSVKQAADDATKVYVKELVDNMLSHLSH